MSECPISHACVFHLAVEPSLVKRLKHASAFPYCRGGKHEECAVHVLISRGEPVPHNLLPDGGYGDYDDSVGAQHARAQSVSSNRTRFLVVDDSMVFATIAANAIRQQYPDAEVDQCHSYEELVPCLAQNAYSVIVSGHGIGDGKTVHDVRELTASPIVLFTGRPLPEDTIPRNARMVMKAAGPTALRDAVAGLLAV